MIMEHFLKILLVDNEEVVHQIIIDYLRDSGHKVDRVHSKCEALEVVKKHNYDLALVDMRILNMDKFFLLTSMQEARPEMSVVVIIGYGDMDTAIQTMRHGVIDFLTKPVKLLELDAVLEKSIRHRSLVVQCRQAQLALQEYERRHNKSTENKSLDSIGKGGDSNGSSTDR